MVMDVSNPANPIKWLLTPHNRDALVHTYQLAEQLITAPDASREILERAFQRYALFMVHHNILTEHGGREIRANVGCVDTPVIRASIHRMNCQLLRIMASLEPCSHGCCCNCAASYDDIACNAWVNKFHDRPQEN